MLVRARLVVILAPPLTNLIYKYSKVHTDSLHVIHVCVTFPVPKFRVPAFLCIMPLFAFVDSVSMIRKEIYPSESTTLVCKGCEPAIVELHSRLHRYGNMVL